MHTIKKIKNIYDYRCLRLRLVTTFRHAYAYSPKKSLVQPLLSNSFQL